MNRVGNVAMRGFSIVELLVVIAIIGILAAIVPVGYVNIQNRSYDSAVQSDLLSNMKTLNRYYADNSTYPSSTQLASYSEKLKFIASNYQLTSSSAIYCRSSTNSAAALVGKSKSGKSFVVTSSSSSATEATFAFSGSFSTICPAIGAEFATSPNAFWLHSSVSGWVSYVNAN